VNDRLISRAPIALLLAAMMLLATACARQPELLKPRVFTDDEIMQTMPGRLWVAEQIHGRPVVDMSHTSMVFTTDGLVKGRGGCNTYSARYMLKKGIMTFSDVTTTLQICPDALMDQEDRFFESLRMAQAVSFEYGMLVLKAKDGKDSVFTVHE